MKLAIKYILSILILLPFTISLSGRSKTFRSIMMSDGLSDLLVNTIYKDSSGFVWLGTDNSLDRFDGIHIKSYSFDGVDSKRKRVNALVETDDVFLWVGNGAGLWVLNRYNGEMIRILPDLIDMTVWSMVYNGHDTLFLGTDKGLCIIYIEKFRASGKFLESDFKQVLVDANVLSLSNRIKSINLDDHPGIVWLASSKGLYSYSLQDAGIHSHLTESDIPQELEFRTMTRMERTLYLGTESLGLFSYDVDNDFFQRFMDVGSGVISSLSTDGDDRLYVATDGNGICCISHHNKKIVSSYRHNSHDANSIRSNSVYSLLVDREGIVWIGFYSAGLDYSLYQNDLFDVYAYSPLFDSNNLPVRSFFINEKEKLIGTRDGLYYINEETGIVRVFKMPELRSNLILSIGFYHQKYYIGTYGGGLYILDPKTLMLSDFNPDNSFTFQKGHIFCLTPDVRGNLWIGTSEGVYRYSENTGKPRLYNSTNSQMPEGNVYDIFFDSTNKGWICTDRGLCIYDVSSESIKSNIFPDGFPVREKFRMVYEDSGNNLYFLPDKGDVFITDLSMSSFGNFPLKVDMQYGNAYKSVMEDNDGNIWLGCDNGLLRTGSDGNHINVFGFNDGLPDQSFMNNAIYKDETGILWFGNTKGLVFVNPEQVDSIRKIPYELVFTDIFLRGRPVDEKRRMEAIGTRSLILDKKENSLTFRFMNLSYNDPLTMAFEYKLAGHDAGWNFLSAKNEVSYYDIKPGRYTFFVRAPGDEMSEVSMNIIIKTSHTAIVWIVLFAISLILLFIFLFFKKRKMAVKKVRVADDFRESSPNDQNELDLVNKDVREKNKKDLSPSQRNSPIVKSEEGKYKSNRLSQKECKDLSEKLAAYMKTKKPYTNPDLKISDVAQALGVSSPLMSYLFNQYIHQSYYDYMNEYRVEEFKQLVRKPEYKRYTLSALAELCGFSSRASFFRSFKKITGITPNEYISSLN